MIIETMHDVSVWFVVIAIELYILPFLNIFLAYRKNIGTNQKSDPRADAEVCLAFGEKNKAVEIPKNIYRKTLMIPGQSHCRMKHIEEIALNRSNQSF